MKKFKVYAATHGSVQDLQDAIAQRIAELGGDIEMSEDIEMSTDIEAGEGCNCGQENCPECNPDYIQASSGPAKMYRNYEEFVDTCYPEYNVEQEDMDEEIFAVEDEIRKWGEDPAHCPTFWRDDYEEPIVQLGDDSFYFVNIRGVGQHLEARLTPVADLYDDYGTEFGLPIEGCDAIMTGTECKYVVEDTYGAPQAGVDVKEFATYEDLEEYLEANPDVQERMSEGYALIKEC